MTRHHATTEEVLTHPVRVPLSLKGVRLRLVGKDMKEKEPFWSQPLGNPLDQFTPVPHVFKHLHGDYSIKGTHVLWRLEIIHICHHCCDVC